MITNKSYAPLEIKANNFATPLKKIIKNLLLKLKKNHLLPIQKEESKNKPLGVIEKLPKNNHKLITNLALSLSLQCLITPQGKGEWY